MTAVSAPERVVGHRRVAARRHRHRGDPTADSTFTDETLRCCSLAVDHPERPNVPGLQHPVVPRPRDGDVSPTPDGRVQKPDADPSSSAQHSYGSDRPVLTDPSVSHARLLGEPTLAAAQTATVAPRSLVANRGPPLQPGRSRWRSRTSSAAFAGNPCAGSKLPASSRLIARTRTAVGVVFTRMEDSARARTP